MTREEIVSVVLANTGRTDKQDLMLMAIDLCLTEISQVHSFTSMREDHTLTLDAGSSSTNLPPGTIGIWEARISIPDDPETIDSDESATEDVTQFQIMSKKRVLELTPSLARTSTGRPSFGYIDAGVLVVVPPSDQAYAVEVTLYRSFSGLAIGDSTPSGGLDSSIIAWVTAYVYRAIQNRDDSSLWMQEYGRTLQQAIRSDNSKMFIEGREHAGFRGGNISDDGYRSPTPWLDPFARR